MSIEVSFKEKVKGLGHLFKRRPTEAETAWERERWRVASKYDIPTRDKRIMMNIPEAKEYFIDGYELEKGYEKIIRRFRQEQQPNRSHGIEDPTHELQTEF